MNSNDIITKTAREYSLDWGTDTYLDLLHSYIDQDPDPTRFTLHCVQAAAHDLKFALSTHDGELENFKQSLKTLALTHDAKLYYTHDSATLPTPN